MKQEIDLLGYVQFDHMRWLNQLLFSKKEIEIYQNRLLELLKASEKEKDLDGLSLLYKAFENIKPKLNTIIAKIKKHMTENKVLKHSNGNLKTMINSMHTSTSKDMENFHKEYFVLKKRFQQFSELQNGRS